MVEPRWNHGGTTVEPRWKMFLGLSARFKPPVPAAATAGSNASPGSRPCPIDILDQNLKDVLSKIDILGDRGFEGGSRAPVGREILQPTAAKFEG